MNYNNNTLNIILCIEREYKIITLFFETFVEEIFEFREFFKNENLFYSERVHKYILENGIIFLHSAVITI